MLWVKFKPRHRILDPCFVVVKQRWVSNCQSKDEKRVSFCRRCVLINLTVVAPILIGDTIVLTTQIDSQHVNTYTYWFVSEWERKSCQIKFVKTDVKLSGQFSRQSDSGSHTRRCRGKRGLLSDKRMSRISWSQSYISWSWFPLWQQSLVNLFHMQSNIRQCTVAKKLDLKLILI